MLLSALWESCLFLHVCFIVLLKSHILPRQISFLCLVGVFLFVCFTQTAPFPCSHSRFWRAAGSRPQTLSRLPWECYALCLSLISWSSHPPILVRGGFFCFRPEKGTWAPNHHVARNSHDARGQQADPSFLCGSLSPTLSLLLGLVSVACTDFDALY